MTRFSVYQPRDFAGDGAHPAALVLRWSGIGSGTAGRLTEPPFHEIEDLPACPDSYEHVFRQAFVETPLSPQRLALRRMVYGGTMMQSPALLSS